MDPELADRLDSFRQSLGWRWRLAWLQALGHRNRLQHDLVVRLRAQAALRILDDLSPPEMETLRMEALALAHAMTEEDATKLRATALASAVLVSRFSGVARYASCVRDLQLAQRFLVSLEAPGGCSSKGL
jgi:hypothetical protein